MRRMMVLGVSAALGLLTVGCGDDDGGASELSGDRADAEGVAAGGGEGYVGAVDETLTAVGLPGDASSCVAEVYVEVVGADQLAEHATPDEIREAASLAALGVQLDEAGSEALYAGVTRCFDVRRFFFSLIAGQDGTVINCLDRAVPDDVVQQAFVGGFLLGDMTSTPEVETSMANAYDQCAPQPPAP